MNFFSHQEKARQKTNYLIFIFTVSVILIIAVVYLGLVLSLKKMRQGAEPGLFYPEIFIATSFGVLAVIGVGLMFKLSVLKGGGRAVAESLGGTLLERGNNGYREQMLLNVVEEMAIASGTPVPQVYIMQDRAINAFAAGWSPEQAVIGITTGAINAFNREELQGVIAHEFSHILNGDMRINIRLIAVIFGISCLAFLGRGLLRTTSFKNKNKGNQQVLIGVILLVVGYIGALAGKLIQSAISRQREFLADASAVQFTRNPQGISGALKKILDNKFGSSIKVAETDEVEHMLFSASKLNSMFATHPPLHERIKRLGIHPVNFIDEAEGSGEKLYSGLAGSARAVIDQVPANIKKHTEDAYDARLLVFGFIIHHMDIPTRNESFELFDKSELEIIKSLLPDIKDEQIFVETELAIPALQELSDKQKKSFLARTKQLIALDKLVTPRELALFVLLRHCLLKPKESSSGSTEDMKVVLFVLSLENEKAYQRGLEELGSAAGTLPKPAPQRFIEALDKIANNNLAQKMKFLNACKAVAGTDNEISLAESELLRTISLSVGCPVQLGE